MTDITQNMKTHASKVHELADKFNSVYQTDPKAADNILRDMRDLHGRVLYDQFSYLLYVYKKNVDDVTKDEFVKISTNESFADMVHRDICKCQKAAIKPKNKNTNTSELTISTEKIGGGFQDILNQISTGAQQGQQLINQGEQLINQGQGLINSVTGHKSPAAATAAPMKGGDLGTDISNIFSQTGTLAQQGQSAMNQIQGLIDSVTNKVKTDPNAAKVVNKWQEIKQQAKTNPELAKKIEQGKQQITTAAQQGQQSATNIAAQGKQAATNIAAQGQQAATNVAAQAKSPLDNALNKINALFNQGQQTVNTATTQGQQIASTVSNSAKQVSDAASGMTAVFKGGDDYDELSIYNTNTESFRAPKYNERDLFASSEKKNNDETNTTEFLNALTTETAEKLYNQTGGAETRVDVPKVTKNVENPTIINYWAEWCGYSRQFNPIWNDFKKSAATKYPNLQIADYDVGNDDKRIAVSKKAGVTGYPTVVFFYNGNRYSQGGVRSVDKLNEFVDSVLKTGK